MTDAVKLEPCPHCGAQMRVGERSAFHPASDDCWLGNMERGQPLELGEWDYAAWNRRAGLEAVRREALEEAAKATKKVCDDNMAVINAVLRNAKAGQYGDAEQERLISIVRAISAVKDEATHAIRALAALPQEGAAEGEGQGKDHE